MNCNCPKCGSENTQNVKILHASGSSSGVSVGTGFSSGTSHSHGTGFGTHSSTHTTTTRTKNQTELAKKFDPGARPSKGTGLIVMAVIFGFFLILSFWLSSLFSLKGGPGVFSLIWALLAGAMIAIYVMGTNGRKEQLKIWLQRQEYLDAAWFCHRCGHDWIPQ